MKLPLKIAEGLQSLLRGETIPQSQLKHPVIDALLTEGLISRKLQGRTKAVLYVTDKDALSGYINNHFGIANLSKYIEGYAQDELTRSEAIEIASDSKLKAIRTFKGFLVNCYMPIQTTLNGKALTINPAAGTYTFIADFENFIPEEDVTIVGIENPENFRHIEKQRAYFGHIKPLFVSRYPQSKDLAKWLSSIPNNYLHFGDFDFEGVNIFLNEYQKHLGAKASFFIPDNIVDLLPVFGNGGLYDKQFSRQAESAFLPDAIKELFALMHRHKKVLEQEILISR